MERFKALKSWTSTSPPNESIYTVRRHYRNSSTSLDEFESHTPKLRSHRLRLALLLTSLLILFRWWMFPIRHGKLRDQPIYEQPKACQAKMCNPAGRCSTWSTASGAVNWTGLVENGLYRDLGKINVDPGCEVELRVDGEGPRPEQGWMRMEGNTSCVDEYGQTGWVPECRNLVSMQVKDRYNEEIVMNHIPSSVDPFDITLVTQFSVNRLNTFNKVLDVWKGPISIAIYLTEEGDIDELDEFLKIPENFKAYEHIHLTLVKPPYNTLDRLAYPINHLRNLAWAASTTDYILVIDADFVPSPNLHNFLQEQYTRMSKSPKIAWVVPCFGLVSDYPIPTKVSTIRNALDNKKAYITDPGAGHGPTLYRQLGLSHGFHVYDEVCYESQWEPYYVISRHTPMYDVRFKNQGGDKQSHALQLNSEQYTFRVWRNVFLAHQEHTSMVWPGQGKIEPPEWNYFGGFMREMESIYGPNVRWPRGCNAAGVGWQDQGRPTLGLGVIMA
ncbi:glycosyltransferase family 49 protein [Phycomyces blakesleeanus NRRL 1555(-)]|uniref:Glycosyltransferase family 49 protein n=1 Tax=Phycomyces blakesleeanus (strain ATCC 8743b / DSM 1359 / FGSC 10004 / NBRC 33097 / NRRL 1555) TaxID=763407 RepID=A0A162URJ1_PHYB8|nr:glycosyltransferase family 49 protein [Phycomyces blakesleeanus NRRL 1555(-)]OAD77333.1 glycosyltransferase family 49 protein [Phycomyces blakesleeanus NRRL 1555(-)]|eukprot:XP_018295373.1 glycosyltransferase family 49 protein [Phycomyces blakesleeanus NRRL 1555(-)]